MTCSTSCCMRSSPHRLPSRPSTPASTACGTLLSALIAPGSAKDAGIAAGVAAAAAMMGSRVGDGRFDNESFPVGTGTGEWQTTPPALANDASAWVATARPIAIEQASDFRSAGPRNINSAVVRPRVRRGQGTRSCGQHAHSRAAGGRRLLQRQPGRALQPHVPSRLAGRGTQPRRGGPVVRDAQHQRRRRLHRLLGRQGSLAVLAADHRHPQRRHRRQPAHDR